MESKRNTRQRQLCPEADSNAIRWCDSRLKENKDEISVARLFYSSGRVELRGRRCDQRDSEGPIVSNTGAAGSYRNDWRDEQWAGADWCDGYWHADCCEGVMAACIRRSEILSDARKGWRSGVLQRASIGHHCDVVDGQRERLGNSIVRHVQ